MSQLEFDFDDASADKNQQHAPLVPFLIQSDCLPIDCHERGYQQFREEMDAAIRCLEVKYGLILNKQVRLTLYGFPGDFTGKLILDDQLVPDRPSAIRLRMGQTLFESHEIQSCVLVGE